jgi:hypothetical protein
MQGKEYSTRRAKALLMRALMPISRATWGGGTQNSRKATYSDSSTNSFSELSRITARAASMSGMDPRWAGSCTQTQQKHASGPE